MKIVFFTPSISIVGGAERVTSVLANGFVQKGHQVTIVSLYQEQPPAYELDPEVTLLPLFNKKVKMMFNALPMLLKIRSIMKDESPDLWVDTAHGLSYLTIPASFSFNIPVVLQSHSSLKGVNAPLHHLSLWFIKKWAHKIICISNADAFDFHKYLGNSSDRIVSIPNPLPFTIEKFPPHVDSNCLLCIASNYYDKGLDRLLGIFVEIHRKLPCVTLKIVGKACHDSELLKHLESIEFKDSIILVPHTSNIKQEYLSCALTLMTSRQEVFPMILIESMACGIPVIAYNCHTGPDEIIQNGVTGYVVSEGDADTFVTCTLELLQNVEKRASFGKECINQSGRYQLSTIIAEWEKYILPLK